VPGFFTDDWGDWHMFLQPEGGLFVPVCNLGGYVQGLQMRLDGEIERRHRWFSSKGFHDGTGAAAWVHVVGDILSETARVTSGALRADAESIRSGGALYVAVPGAPYMARLAETLRTLQVSEALDVLDNPEASARLEGVAASVGVRYARGAENDFIVEAA
jgi:hypothetical protein